MSKTKDISRRTMVAGAACAVPAIALADLAIPEEHPDAELLRLGREFEARYVQWLGYIRAESPHRTDEEFTAVNGLDVGHR
jgi:hypothetical protein